MERRRFVPRMDGLEVRELMAAGVRPAATAVAPVAAAKQPLWERRVDNLAGFLRTINPDRHVPPELVTALQNDLKAIATRLSPPPSWALREFNLQLRAAIPHDELRTEDAAGLNRLFGVVLEKSGAPAAVVAKFQSDMQQLASIDAIQSNAAQTAAGDYALLTQMSMGAGLVKPKPATATAKPAAKR